VQIKFFTLGIHEKRCPHYGLKFILRYGSANCYNPDHRPSIGGIGICLVSVLAVEMYSFTLQVGTKKTIPGGIHHKEKNELINKFSLFQQRVQF
jgi:hypothetical protein